MPCPPVEKRDMSEDNDCNAPAAPVCPHCDVTMAGPPEGPWFCEGACVGEGRMIGAISLAKPMEEMALEEQVTYYHLQLLQMKTERDHFVNRCQEAEALNTDLRRELEQAQEDRAALKGMVERARADGRELQRDLDRFKVLFAESCAFVREIEERCSKLIGDLVRTEGERDQLRGALREVAFEAFGGRSATVCDVVLGRGINPEDL